MSGYTLMNPHPLIVSLESEAQAEVIVAVGGRVVVTISNATVGRIVVPAATTIDAIRALLHSSQISF